jgi:hypothetical protein
MTKINMAKAWVLVRQGRVAEWLNDSVLVFGSRKEAQKFAREVIALTPLRGQFSPHPLAGRLLAQVSGRPIALRLNGGDDRNTYVVLSASDSAAAHPH